MKFDIDIHDPEMMNPFDFSRGLLIIHPAPSSVRYFGPFADEDLPNTCNTVIILSCTLGLGLVSKC